MKLLRFKDNTYSWIDGDPSPIFSEKEAVAYGIWSLKIPRDEINLGLVNLKASDTKKENIAIFGNKTKIYLYTTKSNGMANKPTFDEESV